MRAGIIFDCDGVLVDSEPISCGVLAEMLTAEGLPMTTEESMRDFMGRSWASCRKLIEDRLGRPLSAGFADRYHAALAPAFERGLRPVPGIVEALDAIDGPTCVASSGHHEKIRMTLGLTGLYDRFEGRIYSATEVPRGKPHPDLFLHAAERTGLDPSASVVVEDAVPGVRAGVAAGMRVLAYARFTPAEDLEAAGGEVFDDMRDLPRLLAR